MWLPARFRNQLDFRFAFCFAVDAVPDRKMLHLDLGSARRAGPSNRINHFPHRNPNLTVGPPRSQLHAFLVEPKA